MILSIAAVYSCRCALRVRDQRDAIRKIQSQGGHVIAEARDTPWLRWCFGDGLIDEYPVGTSVDLYEPSHEMMQLLRALPEVKELQIAGDNVSDDDLDCFLNCPLQIVRLSCRNITDRGIARLAHILSIRELGIDSELVTDDGLQHLGLLTNLEDLTLNCPKVSDHGMKHLTKLAKLRYLGVEGTDVTSSGAVELQNSLPAAEVNR